MDDYQHPAGDLQAKVSLLCIDENAADLDKQLFGQLKIVGVLALKLEFINIITREQCKPKPPGNFDPAQKLPFIGTLPEKSLKGDARSHQASFDAPIFHSACVPKEAGSREVFHTGEPFAIFQSKYRSLGNCFESPSTSSPYTDSTTAFAAPAWSQGQGELTVEERNGGFEC
ncbi:hypothetical protein HBI56_120880 [Parastagonospora nodorum]|uniref:DUF7918 domain-containing protein n=1 Tax=Phaeosphaeria nodorum (strain SN15 / ATCC MYA-4574 / FGSC 10173) TaxID=321614 RepID=A0A7U2I7D0_PHANO|nr:hypothetical protein HBH56_053860 [Parastagonospora nodorum]QRD02283.1 hypothetical protein JI435_052540 [Parastagonospora nodorum SN15]KAH3935726.1 hypothetical protein HBH54_039660 [Parastagonospora nodorum]KAH3948647.1 hypothetical protein HBH53_099630 [Parastagonospora nodorum]KAH3988908.1 hypothetical protein HBH52_028320 [Parastagonospora nodorum]